MRPTVDPISRYARRGLWALPVFAALLFVGTISHQPPPQTDIAAWSKYVTTNEFLISHLVASIGGSMLLVLGVMALGIVLAERGSVRLGLWGLTTGVISGVLLTSIFGIAAFAQPAIGRFYLAGHTALAQPLYYDAAQGTPMVVTALIALVLLSASIILFGIAVVRSRGLPKVAGIGLAISGPLFAIVGFAFDNWIQSVASALMLASLIWIVVRLRSRAESVPSMAPAAAPIAAG
jgi:hypothetical protein